MHAVRVRRQMGGLVACRRQPSRPLKGHYRLETLLSFPLPPLLFPLACTAVNKVFSIALGGGGSRRARERRTDRACCWPRVAS